MSFTLKQYVYIPPPDELDAVLEREAIERYVTHITNGDRTTWALEGYWAEPRGVKKQEERHWDMETILANWAALFGAAPSAASLAAESPPPDLTQPTVRLVASQPPARASGASSTRRSTVTQPDEYTYRAANAIPNGRQPDITEVTVESIMRDRGISKRRAYIYLRQMSEEQHAGAEIPTNQRERVLEILYRSDGSIPESRMLMQALQDEGYAIDGHDAVKVLWSLQKTGHVKFRERQNPKYLYGIRLTDLGKAEGKRLMTKPKTGIGGTIKESHQEGDVRVIDEVILQEVSVVAEPPVPVVTNVGPDQQDEAYAKHIAKVAANAALLQQEINDLGAGKPEPQPVVPWIAGNMGGWPSMRDVRDRARKVTKIREAAALLEEVGEDDAVLALLDKITFTPLEEEVVALLRFLGETE